ncbi:hypothetical protein [Nocardioides ungokensis]|nr:hypothetical protein [Nocardioides ungokensis]
MRRAARRDGPRTGEALTITPMEVASPKPECLVAVTTIALVSVPSDAV